MTTFRTPSVVSLARSLGDLSVIRQICALLTVQRGVLVLEKAVVDKMSSGVLYIMHWLW